MILRQTPLLLRGPVAHPLVRARCQLAPLHPRIGLTRQPFTPVSARRHFIEAAVIHTQELITGLHHVTGTPWYITIPLVSLAINLVRLPFFILSRRIQQRRVQLSPLLFAWQAHHAKSVPPRPGATTASLLNEVSKRVRKSQKRIYRDFGVQQWKLNGSLVTLPVWLVVIEALRRMCGGPRGLLGNLIFSNDAAAHETAFHAGAQAAAVSTPITAAATAVVDPTSAAVAGSLSDAVATTASSVEVSLATGGALWFPDLLQPDPYYILPTMLSFTLAANLMPNTVAKARDLLMGSSDPLQGGWRRRLHRGFILAVLTVGPITMDMPSALHLYWIFSSGFALAFSRLVAIFLPLPTSMAARCKGQTRIMLLPKVDQKPSPGVQKWPASMPTKKSSARR